MESMLTTARQAVTEVTVRFCAAIQGMVRVATTSADSSAAKES